MARSNVDELVDRYLQNVRFWLPRAQQDDVIAELSEDIRSEMEDQQAERAHKLDESEVAGILKRRGHPIIAASRFLPRQQLIGLALLPSYWFVLKLVVLWILAPVFVVIVGPITVMTADNRSLAVLVTAWQFMMAAIFTVGLITVVFGLIERFPSKHTSLEKWDPRKLPRTPARHGVQPVSRFMAGTELVMIVAGWAVWLYFCYPANLNFSGVRVIPHPIWRNLFWLTNVVILSAVPASAVSLAQPAWIRARLTLRLVSDALTLILMGVLLAAGPWVQIAAPRLPAAGVAVATKWTNIDIRIALMIIAIANVADAVRESLRIFRQRASSRRAGNPATA
jgi:hypothetical protein